MAGPLSIGVGIPGLIDFSMGPLSGIQVRLFDALAPQAQTSTGAQVYSAAAAAQAPASVAQFSASSAAAALTQQLGQRIEQFRSDNPSLPTLELRGLQVRYPAAGGSPEVIITPAEGLLPNGDAEQTAQQLAAYQQIISQFLQDNDALLRQIAAANGGTVNLLLAGTAAQTAAPTVTYAAPAAASQAANLAITYGPFSLSTGAQPATAPAAALTGSSA